MSISGIASGGWTDEQCVLENFAEQSKVTARNCSIEQWGSRPWIYEIKRNGTLLAYGIGTIHVLPQIVGIQSQRTANGYKILGPLGDIVDAAAVVYGTKTTLRIQTQ